MCIRVYVGKIHREEFPLNADKKKRDILELVHTYICRSMQTRSLGGAYYFLLFIDDCTRFSWIYFIGKKSQTFQCFKEFMNMVEKKTGKFINILRSN